MSGISNRTDQFNPLSFAADNQSLKAPSEVSLLVETAPGENETTPVELKQSSKADYYSHIGIDTTQRSKTFFERTTTADSANLSGATATARLNTRFLGSLDSLELNGKRHGGVHASVSEAKQDAIHLTPELKARFEKIGAKYHLPPALLAGLASRESNMGGEFHGKTGRHSVLYGWSDFRHGSYQGFGVLQIDKNTADISSKEKRELQAAYGKIKLDPFSLQHIDQAAREFGNKLAHVKHQHPHLSEEAQLATAVSRYNGGRGHVWPDSDRGTTGGDYANDTLARARYYAQNWDTLGGGKTSVVNEPPAPSTAQTPSNDSTANAPLARGQSGDAVRQLQQNLIKLGQLNAAQVRTGIGIFGPRTEAAVVAFQRNVGLTADGRLDAATSSTINAVLGAVKRGDNSNPKLIEQVQNKLVEAGYLTKEQIGSHAGTFGPRTEAALKRFQADHNLPPTGRFGRLTYNALFNSAATTAKPISNTNPPPQTVKQHPAAHAAAPAVTNQANGLPTTPGEANKFFKTQFYHPKWNPTGPNRSADCGPASLEAALEAVGVHPISSGQASIEQARNLMHAYDHHGTSYLQIQAGARRAHAEADVRSGWAELDKALESGKAVVVSGKHFKEYRQAFGDSYHAHAPGPGHFIAIVGRDKSGRYLVADPINDTGTVALTRPQLTHFFQEKPNHAPTHMVVIGR